MSDRSVTTVARVPAMAWFALILALAAGLRVYLALTVPPWFAELYVVHVASQRLGEMLHLARADIGPPFALIWRWLWTHLVGTSAVAQKCISLISGLGSMAVAYWLARRVFGARAALLAAALVALHPEHVLYSQEIEDFSLVWLLVTGMIASGWAWHERPGRASAALWFVTVTVGLYTEYSLLLVWPLTALMIALTLPPGRSRRPWLLLNLAVAVAFLPLLPTFLEQLARESYGRFWRFPSPHALAEVWAALGFHSRWALLLMVPLALVPLFRRETRKFAALLWVVLLLTPFSTRVWVVLLPRQVMFLVPLFLMLVAGGIAAVPARAARIGLALVAIAFGVRASLHPPRFTEAVATANAGDYVARHARPGELVVHAESHSLLTFSVLHPELRNRLLRDPADRLPFFEGGLIVADSFYLAPSAWRGAAAASGRWWGVWVNRALATRGRVWRAGEAPAESLRAAAGDSAWHQKPVTVWQGGAVR